MAVEWSPWTNLSTLLTGVTLRPSVPLFPKQHAQLVSTCGSYLKTLYLEKKRKTNKKPQASETRALWRVMQRLVKAQKMVEEMKIQNKQLTKIEFEQKISGLPSKQQLVVRACLEAAGRKSAKGMRYSGEWLLEGILIQMKHPELHEHIRRHNIFALPGRTCLQKSILNATVASSSMKCWFSRTWKPSQLVGMQYQIIINVLQWNISCFFIFWIRLLIF